MRGKGNVIRKKGDRELSISETNSVRNEVEDFDVPGLPAGNISWMTEHCTEIDEAVVIQTCCYSTEVSHL